MACHDDSNVEATDLDGTWLSDCVSNVSPAYVEIKGPYRIIKYTFLRGLLTETSTLYLDDKCTNLISTQNITASDSYGYTGSYTLGENVTESDGATAERISLNFDAVNFANQQGFTPFSNERIFRLEGNTLYFGPYDANGVSAIDYQTHYIKQP
jgi:hypothetical protein